MSRVALLLLVFTGLGCGEPATSELESIEVQILSEKGEERLQVIVEVAATASAALNRAWESSRASARGRDAARVSGGDARVHHQPPGELRH